MWLILYHVLVAREVGFVPRHDGPTPHTPFVVGFFVFLGLSWFFCFFLVSCIFCLYVLAHNYSGFFFCFFGGGL